MLKELSLTLITALVALTAAPVFSKSMVPEEVKTNRGCKLVLFRDALKPNAAKVDKAQWSGGCAGGYADGYGVSDLHWDDGRSAKTTATAKLGKYEGPGTVEYSTANGRGFARGNFVQGQLQGVGEYSFETLNGDTTKYRGDLVDGTADGLGRLETNPAIYIGEFHESKPSGAVRVEFKNGNVYEGGFKDFKRVGKGKFTYSDGVTISGYFQDGDFPVSGKIEWPSGATYEGQLAKGRPQGNGRMTYVDRTTFYGEFKDGLADGDGVVEYQGKRINMTADRGKFSRRYDAQEMAEIEAKRQEVENKKQEIENAKEELRVRKNKCFWNIMNRPSYGPGFSNAEAAKCDDDPNYDLRAQPSNNQGFTCSRDFMGNVNCNPR